MSEHIVHTAIVEDSFALIMRSDEIPSLFKEIAENYIDFARLGCITISGDKFSFLLLEESKAMWNSHTPEQLIEPILAYVFGWVSHRAADRQMKPIWKEPDKPKGSADVDPKLSPAECSIYHEGFMYRKYYAENGNLQFAIDKEKFTRIAGNAVKHDLLEWLMQNLLLRNLFEIQTIEENEDINTWFEVIDKRVQRFYVDLDRYFASSINPDPGKLKEFVTDINFYCDNDLIISAVKRLKHGETVSDKELREALDAEPSSHYGQALLLSYRYIKSAGEYFFSDMSIDTLKERLDIGKPGRDGRPA